MLAPRAIVAAALLALVSFSACAGGAPSDATARDASASSGQGGSVAVAPAQTSAAAPAPSSSADAGPRVVGPKLVLTPSSASVRSGERVTFSIKNVGDAPFRFHHPGGSNGCDAFHWELSATSARGELFVDMSQAPGRLCTMAIVPPSDIEIAAGEEVTIALDTARGLLALDAAFALAPRDAMPTQLPRGRYAITVAGAGIVLAAVITITD